MPPLALNPVSQIIQDRQAARDQGDTNADICFLALAGDAGPSVRTLVLRDIEQTRFTLFLNKTSPKWRIMEACPQAQLLLWYNSVQRQYRISGKLRELPQEIVQTHWQRRPIDSKYLDQAYDYLGAQSSILDRRDTLIECVAALKKKQPAEQLSMPPSVAGVVLLAEQIECLDLNSPHRLHDRRRYQLQQHQPRQHQPRPHQPQPHQLQPPTSAETWSEQLLIP